MTGDPGAPGPPTIPATTIFALSSGALPAGIAVVRISGPAAGPTLAALAGRLPSPRRATRARLRDADGDLLDDALILWFPGPASATGEDVAELHLHGGRAVVAAVLAALARRPGLRAAAPGEFTRRALEHGRIDLAAAEGLADLLAAETERARRQALTRMDGAVARAAADWQARLTAAAAEVEALLDFDEEGDVAARGAGEGVRARLTDIAAELARALAAPPAERLRDGLAVVVAGPPNAGKSTLVNAIVGREVAIATPVAGTTRDVIDVPVALDGIPLRLMDTAGLRARGEADAVEAIGIARAEAALARADILLWLGDPSAAPAHPARVLLSAQADRRTPAAGVDLAVSAVTGAGMGALRARIVALADACLPPGDAIAFARAEQVALAAAHAAVVSARDAADWLIVAEELRAARTALDPLVGGGAGVEAMLDALFARFCVGK